jgi:hypothetical protein
MHAAFDYRSWLVLIGNDTEIRRSTRLLRARYDPEIRSDDDMYYIRIADFTRFDPAERASES